MKKLLFLVFVFGSLLCEGQSWVWGRGAVPKAIDKEGGVIYNDHTMAVDAKGNAYLTGGFSDSLMFGSFMTKGTSPTILKYDASGNVIWLEQAVAASYKSQGYGNSVALDTLGNVYFTGGFYDTVSFGANMLISNSWNFCVFIAKYNTNGGLLWAKQSSIPSSSSTGNAVSVVTDLSGNVFIAGLYMDTISFGVFTLRSKKNWNVFLVKYDENGNVLWAKQPLQTDSARSEKWCSIATDKFGNVYMTGEFTDTVSFGVDTLKSKRNYNVFFTKYDANGNVVWAKQSTTPSNKSWGVGASIALDGQGKIYITGFFSDTMSFSANKLHSYYQSTNVFLAKYDTSGSLLWVESADSIDFEQWYGVSVVTDTLKQGGGYLVIDGYRNWFTNILTFGGETFSAAPYYSSVVIILKFDSSGNTQCGSIFTEGGQQYVGNGMGADPLGQYVYIAGDLLNNTIFGNDTVIANGPDIPFIARWLPCGDTLNTEGIRNYNKPAENISLYPNPNNGAFTIALVGAQYFESMYIEIYNVLGENIYQAKLNSNNTEISLGGQPAGVYFYRVLKEDGNLIGEGKVIVAH